MKLFTPVPTNAKTIAFCFFEGTVLSFFIGPKLAEIRPFTPPEWTAQFYFCAVLFSGLSLLIWSLMSLRDLRLLARIGLITVVIFAIGALFPAL